MKIKSVTAVFLCILLLSGVCPLFVQAKNVGMNFADVSVGDWSYEYIAYVIEQGYMIGKSEDMFGPSDNITRAEFVQALYTMAGSPEITSEFFKTHKRYFDVEVEDWYHAATYWASKKNIAIGMLINDSNAYFGPELEIRRADLAVMLMQYIKCLGYELDTVESVPEFEDIYLAPDYSREAIKALAGAGVIVGKSETVFDPLAGATRAEAATMIKALADHSHEKENGWLLEKYCLDNMGVSVNLDSSGQQFRIKFKSTEGYNGKDLLPWDVMMIGDTGPEHPMTVVADIEGIDCGVHGVRFKFRTRHIVGPQNYEDPVFTFNMPRPTLYYYDDEGNRVYYDYEYRYTPENDYDGHEPGIWGIVHEDEILKVTVKVTIGDESETFVFYPAVTNYT